MAAAANSGAGFHVKSFSEIKNDATQYINENPFAALAYIVALLVTGTFLCTLPGIYTKVLGAGFLAAAAGICYLIYSGNQTTDKVEAQMGALKDKAALQTNNFIRNMKRAFVRWIFPDLLSDLRAQ